MNILIVDDEPLIRRSLQKAFEQRGHSVRVAADGLSGVKLWQEQSPDLVFLDVLMPGLSGPQVLQQVGPKSGAIIVLMSAFAGEFDVAAAQGLGATDFVAKPFSNIFELVDKYTSTTQKSSSC